LFNITLSDKDKMLRNVFIMPAGSLKRIRARITNRSRAPRRWWYPVPPQGIRHREAVSQLHESYAKTINKTMFAQLSVGLYCLLKVFGESDKSLLVANTTTQMPLVSTSISFQGFLGVAPFLLVLLSIYLHILYGYWLQLERERLHLNETRENPGEPTIESIPALFSFKERLPLLFTNLVFYWFVPLTLWFMARKAFALKEFIFPFSFGTSIVTLSLLFLQINRCSDSKPESESELPSQSKRWFWNLRRWVAVNVTSKRWFWNLPRWVAFGVLAAFTLNLPSLSESFRRPLDLQREDLHGAWLQGLDMAGADMNNANLQGANLAGARLKGANLQNANLQGANLKGSHLQKAHLNGANLQGANLGGADFEGADLFYANFREVKEMELYRIKKALNGNRAFYSDKLLSALELSPTHNDDLAIIGTYSDGGKIAYIFQPGDKGYINRERHGLIAAEADLPGEDKYTWDAAKKACDELVKNDRSDWYLPSKDELNQLYINRGAVGGFASGVYWSSTELNAGFAWTQYFVDGYQYNYYKTVEWRVRPVRAF
jgi:Protein of unknown function (DUF1566)/Pentapeptide repeats (8 copies)